MKKILATATAFALPGLASAQTIQYALDVFQNLLGLVPPILLAFAIIYFMFGLVKYLVGGASDRGVAIEIMLWGGIAIFVMVSIVSIVRIVQTTFGVDPNAPALEAPQIRRAQIPTQQSQTGVSGRSNLPIPIFDN